MDAASESSAATQEARATVMASAYVECIVRQEYEIPGILAALAGLPEMNEIRRDHERAFTDKCQRLLAPFVGSNGLCPAALCAMLGSAEALSKAAATGDLSESEARAELYATIVAMAGNSHDGAGG